MNQIAMAQLATKHRMQQMLSILALVTLSCSIVSAAPTPAMPAEAAVLTPAAAGGAGEKTTDLCAGKMCPQISLAVCTELAPGGVTGVCNKTTGQCDFGPILNQADMTPCGVKGEVCWQGNCVPNRCASKSCTVPATACKVLRVTSPPCNPLTGQCQLASAVLTSSPDRTGCGKGLVCWKGICVTDKCGDKPCPMLSLAPCSTIAPGGTAGACNPTTGNCESGPIVPLPDGTDCGFGRCKKGQCVQ